MNDIKDAVNGEAPPVARVGGHRLGGPPPPVTPRFLQHVQAATPRCNTSRNTDKAQCCGSGSGSRRAKIRAIFNMCRLRPPAATQIGIQVRPSVADPDPYWIRIPSDPDPYSKSGSGSRRARMTHKSRKLFRNSNFWSAGWSLLKAEGFFCNLDVLYGGLKG